jgi:hypothetical protein
VRGVHLFLKLFGEQEPYFVERRYGELRTILLLRTRVNSSSLRCYHANQKAKERTMGE